MLAYSTNIPKYNPRDIIKILRLMIEGKELIPMQLLISLTFRQLFFFNAEDDIIDVVITKTDPTTRLVILELPMINGLMIIE